MSRIEPDEWATLAEQWRSAPAADRLRVEDLRRRVRRQTMWMYASVAAEVIVTVLALGPIVLVLHQATSWAPRVLAIALLLLTARLWVFTIRNRRGTWRPSDETLEGFRALERLRLERRLASARFVWRFCALTLAGAAVWTAWRWSVLSLPQRRLMAAVGVYLVAWIVGGLLVRRETARRLERSRADDEWQNGASGGYVD